MTTVTVELPDKLAQRLEKDGISPAELETLVLQLVQAYLSEKERVKLSGTTDLPTVRASTAFARRVIENNRELFLELSRR